MENRTEVDRYEAMIEDLRMLQDKYALLTHRGERRVLEIDAGRDITENIMTLRAFKCRLQDCRIYIPEIKTHPYHAQKLLKMWEYHPGTKAYSNLTFNPARNWEGSEFNLWTEPSINRWLYSGDWGTLEEFIKNIICGGVNAKYEYLLNFLAHAWQKPEEKPNVLIGLHGYSGAGAGTFIKLIQAMWGDLAYWTRSKSLLGNNRYRAARSLWLLFDDSKPNESARSKISKVVRSDRFEIPGKQTVESFHRVIARTYDGGFSDTYLHGHQQCILRLSRERVGWNGEHRDYWSSVHDAMKGEAPAFAHHLASRDISGFVPAVIPTDEAEEPKPFFEEPKPNFSASKSFDDFLKERCRIAQGVRGEKRGVFQAYEQWCAANQFGTMTANFFTRTLKARGFPLSRDRRFYRDLEVIPVGATS